MYCLKYQDASIPCESNAQTSDTLVCDRIDGDRLALTTPKSSATVSTEAFYKNKGLNGSGRGDRLCLLSKVVPVFPLFFWCVKVGLPVPWVNPVGLHGFHPSPLIKREKHHVAAQPCMRPAVTGTQAGSCCVWGDIWQINMIRRYVCHITLYIPYLDDLYFFTLHRYMYIWKLDLPFGCDLDLSRGTADDWMSPIHIQDFPSNYGPLVWENGCFNTIPGSVLPSVWPFPLILPVARPPAQRPKFANFGLWTEVTLKWWTQTVRLGSWGRGGAFFL